MFKVTDYAALSTPTYRKIMVMKRITTKTIWARSRWGAIANPHAKVFDSPSTPSPTPGAWPQQQNENSVQYVFYL